MTKKKTYRDKHGNSIEWGLYFREGDTKNGRSHLIAQITQNEDGSWNIPQRIDCYEPLHSETIEELSERSSTIGDFFSDLEMELRGPTPYSPPQPPELGDSDCRDVIC